MLDMEGFLEKGLQLAVTQGSVPRRHLIGIR